MGEHWNDEPKQLLSKQISEQIFFKVNKKLIENLEKRKWKFF